MTDEANAPKRREVELGFMFDHSLMSETARQALSSSTAALALAQLLVERGVIDEQAFAERRSAIAAHLQEKAEREGLGLFLNHGDEDKYALTELPQIDCSERVHLCKAACCTYRFPLARQDVEEGVVQWDLGRPYWNRHDATGYCVHNDPEGRGCRVYDQRPAPCRLFDCRRDKRIWADFDAKVINPELEQNISMLRGGESPGTESDS
jgi:Fe-S-cluster containining protein